MKKIFWMAGGFCAAAVGFLVLYAPRMQSVGLFAPRFEDVRSDNHTIVEPV